MTQPPAQSAFSQDWWRVTLDSIADAVIATDREGRVVFLNPVAQTLTGWTIVEAAGRRLEEVFVVVNETSRAKVENPVEKVFHTGHVAGLANHTVASGDRQHGRCCDPLHSGSAIRMGESGLCTMAST